MKRIALSILIVLFASKVVADDCSGVQHIDDPPCVPTCRVVDPNGDGVLNVSDIFYLVNYISLGGPSPVGDGDINGDGVVNEDDVDYLVAYLFTSGPPPPCLN